jgi:hypothetical protein
VVRNLESDARGFYSPRQMRTDHLFFPRQLAGASAGSKRFFVL